MQKTLNCQVKGSLQDISTGAPACGLALPGYLSFKVRAAHCHNLNGEPEAVGTLSLSELSQMWQPVILSLSHVLWSSWLCPQLHHSLLALSTSTWNEQPIATLWAISCFLMKSIGLLGGKKTLTRPTLNEVICFHGVTGALYFPSSLKKLTSFRYIQRSRDEIYLVRVNKFQWKKPLESFPCDPFLHLPRLSALYPMLWIFCLSASALINRCLWGLAVLSALLPGWFGLLLLPEIKPSHSSGNGSLQELIWYLRFGSLCDSQSYKPTSSIPQEVLHF